MALRLGHRLSHDIDLFSDEKFDVNLLDAQLESYFGNTYKKQGNLSNALFSTINSIKSDFIFDYGKKIKEIETIKTIRIYPIEENIAMKMNAICGRGKKRDFYDLYFILKSFTFKEISNFFITKCGEDKLMLLLKSVTYFANAESDEEPVLLKEKVSWKEVKKQILKDVNFHNL